MSKGLIVVSVYSIVVIILFAIFSFLMTTVNPPLLKNEEDQASTMTFQMKSDLRSQTLVKKVLTNSSLGPAKDQFLELKNHTPVVLGFRANPHGFQSTPDPIKIVYVSPPLWPTDHDVPTKNAAVTTINTAEANSKNSFTQGLRRSRSNLEQKSIAPSSGSIILQIVDDSGQSRLEIKLGSDDFGSIKEPNHLDGNTTAYKMLVKANDSLIERNDLSKDTVIKILSNNTVVVED